MSDFRLGDVLDDYCVKCRRLTNHSIVSLIAAKAAKVRCRTCYSDHDYRNEQIPPSKKDLKKAALFNQVLASASPPGLGPEPAVLESLKVESLNVEALNAEPLAAEPLASEPLLTEQPLDPPPPRPKGRRKKA